MTAVETRDDKFRQLEY